MIVAEWEAIAMGGVLKIGAVVLAIWAAFEIHSNGVHGAFGGIFASGDASEAEESLGLPQRAGAAASRAHDEADERRQRMLGE